jgi:hypothetical protein
MCWQKTAMARGETYDGRRSDERARSFAAARLQADWDYQAPPAPSAGRRSQCELRHLGGGTAAPGFADAASATGGAKASQLITTPIDYITPTSLTCDWSTDGKRPFRHRTRRVAAEQDTLRDYLSRLKTLRLPAGPSFRSCSKICRTADSSSYHFHAS